MLHYIKLNIDEDSHFWVKGFIGKNLLNHLKQYDLIGLGRNEELINGTKIYSTKKLSKILLNQTLSYYVMQQ